MKVKYIGTGSLKSKGHTFETGEVYELLKDTFEYMTTTFPSVFEVVEEPKPEVKEEAKPKPKPKTKRAVAPKE